MQRVMRLIEKVAPTETTVLVQGASGTGKELVARAIHAGSRRRDRPLVTVNCAALQETLLESELFGHEKGSFTGALTAKHGLIEVAEGGTLFIDELAEMAVGAQAKLLRVLEDGHYRRVGSTQEGFADVRVVAATHRALDEELREGRFREDLYYRLAVVTIRLPPLCQRRQDIPELVEHFLTTRRLTHQHHQVDRDAMAALCRYDWPGNVRELANVLERAQILAEGPIITLDDLPEGIAGVHPVENDDPRRLMEVERHHVMAVLEEEKGNKVRAARALGISRRALYRLIDKYRHDGVR
jgi:DNA-binding NtrC family response regulator